MGISRRDLLWRAAPLVLVAASTRPALADTVTYQYDALGRVIQVTYSGGVTVLYTYDAAGNRTEVVRTDGTTFTGTLAVTGTGPVNLRTLANQNGYSGITNATITFQVGSGVTLKGLASSGGAGGWGIDTGTWPSGTKTISLTLQVSGNVYGGGGAGGVGSDDHLYSGTAGGDAITCHENISITVNSGGSVKGGGGGGAGGGGWIVNSGGEWQPYKQGGGGGRGFPNGPGGDGVNNGTGGTTSGGGTGGASSGGTRASGAGGAGGGAATAGASGAVSTGTVNANFDKTSPGGAGAAGYAIRKNGKTVTVTNNGTIVGTQG